MGKVRSGLGADGILPGVLGDHWFDTSGSAVLRVRSAIIPEEFNFLLNPQHPEFVRIIAEPSVPFVFDERLLRSI